MKIFAIIKLVLVYISVITIELFFIINYSGSITVLILFFINFIIGYNLRTINSLLIDLFNG